MLGRGSRCGRSLLVGRHTAAAAGILGGDSRWDEADRGWLSPTTRACAISSVPLLTRDRVWHYGRNVTEAYGSEMSREWYTCALCFLRGRFERVTPMSRRGTDFTLHHYCSCTHAFIANSNKTRFTTRHWLWPHLITTLQFICTTARSNVNFRTTMTNAGLTRPALTAMAKFGVFSLTVRGAASQRSVLF